MDDHTPTLGSILANVLSHAEFDALSATEKLAHINALLFADKKINAIKMWRHFTGMGLRDAKDMIEAHQEYLKAARKAVVENATKQFDRAMIEGR